MNREDTHITCNRKLTMLLAIVAIAVAWSSKTATILMGRSARPQKAHGYPAKSWFRIGFDALRNRLRYHPDRSIIPWLKLPQ